MTYRAIGIPYHLTGSMVRHYTGAISIKSEWFKRVERKDSNDKRKIKGLNRLGYLYFIESPSFGAVKVGFSADPKRRFSQLQSGNPDTLKLLATMKCKASVERVAHEVLGSSRIRGEWFNADGVYELLRWLEPSSEPVTDMTLRTALQSLHT